MRRQPTDASPMIIARIASPCDDGLGHTELAASLGLSERAVRNHIAPMFGRIDVNSASSRRCWPAKRARAALSYPSESFKNVLKAVPIGFESRGFP